MSKEKQKKARQSRRIPRWLPAAAVLLVLGAAAVWYFSRPPQLDLPFLTARCAAVMDRNTGRFRFEKESDTPHSPASLTKLMTLMVVLDDVKGGALNWEDTYTVTPEEAFTPGSKYGMRPGEVFTVRQLVAGTIMASGCDCVQCLVKLTAGDEEAFVRRMNDKAQELKLEGTHFANATGIDSADHYMTARDLARLARALLDAHPEILEFSSVPTLTDGGRTFRNLHRLVGRDSRVKGLKTGTTLIGGYNLLTYAEEDGEGYLIVLLDCSSDTTRFSETRTVVNALFGEA